VSDQALRDFARTQEARHPEIEGQLTADEAREFSALRAAIGLALAGPDATDPNPGVLWSPRSRVLSLLQSLMAERSLAERPERRDEVQYDDRDLVRWALSLVHWVRRFRPRPFIVADGPHAETVPDDLRLALFADWGTGRYGAPVIGATLKAFPDPLYAVLHLGDVYYAGTPKEFRDNLTAYWPTRPGTRSLLLNGNHEVYGGDQAYYDALDGLGQPCSYFAWQNEHWLICALDTAYKDHQLFGGQPDWLRQVVDQAGARKVILLSHHQPFSAFGDGSGPILVDQLRGLLEPGRIHAWYWGHEHRCVVYDAHPSWGTLGRCIGHGGYPYFRVQGRPEWATEAGEAGSTWYRFVGADSMPGGRVLGDDNPYVEGQANRYGGQGFVLLTFAGDRCVETYCRPDGTPTLSQELKS
jgi:hypothetical protein